MDSFGHQAETTFVTMANEWAAIVRGGAGEVGSWEGTWRAFAVEADQIRARGRWVSGPADLLSILGRNGDELFHSRLIAWLLTSTGRHGLGEGFLRGLLNEVWPDDAFSLDGPVDVALEETRIGTNAITGERVAARADLVIRLDGLTVVVENKIDAGEQPAQCERLYWTWAEEPGEVRWLFLSPNGRAPTSATSETAREAWATLGYRAVLRALDAALGALDDRQRVALGATTGFQYAATLRTRFGH